MLLLNCLRQLPRNPSSAESIERILTRFQFRVNDRERIRKLCRFQVMIGDNDIDSFCFCEGNGFDISRTQVNRNDERNTCLCKCCESFVVQSIPFSMSVRDVVRGINADGTKKFCEQHTTGNTVAIIITPHTNLLPVIFCSHDPLNRFFHSRKQERIMTVSIEIRSKKRIVILRRNTTREHKVREQLFVESLPYPV